MEAALGKQQEQKEVGQVLKFKLDKEYYKDLYSKANNITEVLSRAKASGFGQYNIFKRCHHF